VVFIFRRWFSVPYNDYKVDFAVVLGVIPEIYKSNLWTSAVLGHRRTPIRSYEEGWLGAAVRKHQLTYMKTNVENQVSFTDPARNFSQNPGKGLAQHTGNLAPLPFVTDYFPPQ